MPFLYWAHPVLLESKQNTGSSPPVLHSKLVHLLCLVHFPHLSVNIKKRTQSGYRKKISKETQLAPRYILSIQTQTTNLYTKWLSLPSILCTPLRCDSEHAVGWPELPVLCFSKEDSKHELKEPEITGNWGSSQARVTTVNNVRVFFFFVCTWVNS